MTTTLAIPSQAAQDDAKHIQDLAWAFEREQREAFADPYTGMIGRMIKAVDLLKDISDFETGETTKAHLMLAEAIRADIREGGFTDSSAVDLLFRVYVFLNEHMGMTYKGGKWVANPRRVQS